MIFLLQLKLKLINYNVQENQVFFKESLEKLQELTLLVTLEILVLGHTFSFVDKTQSMEITLR